MTKIISVIYFLSAPGSYDIEKSEKIIHQSSGAVTFGIKYKEQKPDDIPGKISCVKIVYEVVRSH